MPRSIYRGVSLNKTSGKWRVTIGVKTEGRSKQRYIGEWSEELAAARAYDREARKQGKPVNFPHGDETPALKPEAQEQAIAVAEDFTPGVYPDIPENDYHAGIFGPVESLSSSEAKSLLIAPKVYQWRKTHPYGPRKAFDFGHMVHGLVLGTGLDVVTIPEDLLSASGAANTKAAKEFVAAARAKGQLPVKETELEEPRACAQAVLTDPVAGPLFDRGIPERSIYAPDPVTGVWMRGRLDWTTDADGATVLVDLKTTAGDASLSDFSREAARLDYAVQREWYRRIWELTTGEYAPRFIHVVVSKTPPYLVNVFEFDATFEYIGKAKVAEALETFAHCRESNEWPGYAPTIKQLPAPAYYGPGQDDEEMSI